jgi:hypothetical protein
MVRTKSAYPEFEPLEFERATELKDIINRAGRDKQAVVIEPEEEGLTGTAPDDLVSPNEKTNVLVRYQRHY